MNKILFSVIIPSYNSSDYVGETLLSLKGQTFKDFEVIIVDDGSIDESVTLCRDLISQLGLVGHVIPRPDAVGKGVSSCRNLGIKMAKGEWICFLDSDDMWFPEKLEKMAALIEKARGQCRAIYHLVQAFMDGEPIDLLKEDQREDRFDVIDDMLSVLVQQNVITTSGVTIERGLFIELNGFDTTLHGVEDYFLWMRASKKTKWCRCERKLTAYRVREQSLMRGRPLKYYVTQATNLVKAMSTSGEFEPAEVAALDKSYFANMKFYASHSLKSHGKRGVLEGLFAMALSGKARLSLSLFYGNARYYLFKKISAIIKRSVRR